MYGSLNFGSPGNLPDEQRDSAANVRANWEQVMGRIGLSERALVEVHQVHGAEVRAVHAGGPAHETPDGRDTCADALVTDDPARAIAVRVADCCPVLIASRDGRTVAAERKPGQRAAGRWPVCALLRCSARPAPT